MASTATAVDFAALDARIAELGERDAELAAHYQAMIEGLDFAGELDTRRAQALADGLASATAALVMASVQDLLDRARPAGAGW